MKALLSNTPVPHKIELPSFEENLTVLMFGGGGVLVWFWEREARESMETDLITVVYDATVKFSQVTEGTWEVNFCSG